MDTGSMMGIVKYFIIGIVLIGIVSYLFSIYNGLILVKNNVKKAWANIDVLLMQRSDEIPKLIETVKAFVKHEKNMIDKVLDARKLYLGSNTVGEKAVADDQLSGALKSLFALSENYPELKSNENFIQFQNRISSVEDDIADRREFYNDSVNNFNIRIESAPDVIVANYMGLKEQEMFEVPESKKEDVQIDFSDVTSP